MRKIFQDFNIFETIYKSKVGERLRVLLCLELFLATANLYFSLLTLTELLSTDGTITWKSNALYAFSISLIFSKECAKTNKQNKIKVYLVLYLHRLEKLSQLIIRCHGLPVAET